MKKINKINLKSLSGQKMSSQDLKRIVGGGSNLTSCCGSGCEAVYSNNTWTGCSTGDATSFCCYG